MGIDYDGGMIVGCEADNALPTEEQLEELQGDSEYECDDNEWFDHHGMETMSLHYDADTSSQYVGFTVDDVGMDKIDEWLADVKEKAKKFKEITGQDAMLIGCQNIW